MNKFCTKNDLIHTLSTDMGIQQYRNENNDSFTYRLCYSAIGLWCLHTAINTTNTTSGTTKHYQTKFLNELITSFSKLYPKISDKFLSSDTQQKKFSIKVRTIYEATGYLLTDEKNHNHLANYGRCVKIANDYLFLGLPHEPYTINGLGIFSSPTNDIISAKEFIVRDSLSCEEYYKSRFDPFEFETRDIDNNELEFFDPKSNKPPSSSWTKFQTTDTTIARDNTKKDYYRIIKIEENLYFANEWRDNTSHENTNRFFLNEYRRLYFAIKSHYGNPLRATIQKIDENYSKISLDGHLPNREYYLLLLLSWPERDAFDKIRFIVKNNYLPELNNILQNIGLHIRRVRLS
ncbi:MAG: hypothetical protein LBD41_06010 [Clostridiales Family XIII bacterium]|jgi:hypothetical protein|nr:hypothetical protein [Clostridiales Family XIII bacterium]